MLRYFVALFCFASAITLHSQENRSFSGANNNLDNRDWGAAKTALQRLATNNYADGISEINDKDLPEPRVISNYLFDQIDEIENAKGLSDYVWVFGQFIDHDITEVASNRLEPVHLSIPQDDPYFDPSMQINTSRNKFIDGTGINTPRQYENEVSAFIDASAVYGSDKARAEWLRSFDGDGKLKTSKGDLLPWNTFSGERDNNHDDNAPFMADDTRRLEDWFVAGDIRANENVLLLSMHTLFVREHNRLCDELRLAHPNWTGDQIYERARKFVGAFLQNITFYEWLPAVGIELPQYQGYREDINPQIFNVFSAAAFRIGHTLINSNLKRMSDNGSAISQGDINLALSFFSPNELIMGVEPYFKGMGTQVMQELDCKVINDLRNILFGLPSDLASINIFRGRDRGLPSYNQLRYDFGLTKVNSFEEYTESPEDASRIEELYGDVNKIDAWVGMLSERHMRGAIFGELTMRILEDQFKVLRDGDRFYFENDPAFTSRDKARIKNTKLYHILMRNTDISLMQKELFYAMPHEDIPVGPELDNTPLSALAYPNPIEDYAQVKVFSNKDQNIELRVFNYQGQLIQTQTAALTYGENFIDVDIPQDWPIGIYHILLESEDHSNVIKVVKK